MSAGGLPFEAAGATHPGLRRPANEDAFALLPELGLFMVANGVSRNAAGKVASAMAVDLVGRFLRGDATWPPGVPGDDSDPLAFFVAAVKRANERIFHTGQRRDDRRGMATTFAGVLVDEGRVRVVHAGDSRVYRLRGRTLERLTEDHSFANEMIAQGMPEAEALALPQAPMLTRALGVGETVAVSARLESAAPGDVLLGCTDGLHGVVAAPEIAGIVMEARDPQAAVRRLIARANERGGPDNVTAVLVRWTGTGGR